MRHVFFAISICCLSLTPVIGQDRAAAKLEYEAKIRGFVKPYVDAKLVNAVSIGVVKGDQTWVGHFGQLSAEDKQAPNDQTLYEIG